MPHPLRRLTAHVALTPVQVSMSGISVSEDAVNLFYYMKAKSTVRSASSAQAASPTLLWIQTTTPASACASKRRVAARCRAFAWSTSLMH